MSAKAKLIAATEAFIEANQFAGVYPQMNAIVARESLSVLQALTAEQAEAVDQLIEAANEGSRRADAKYGFGYSEVSPLDYSAFIEQALMAEKATATIH